mgnify:CR=1 FL=1
MSRYDYIVEVEKFNPYHDSKGRFTSTGGASSMTWRTRNEKKQGLANSAIARAKEKANQKNSGQVLRNPTGNKETDRKREWEGADYAVAFRTDNKAVKRLDLNDDSARTYDGGSWRDGAYENMAISTRAGHSGSIYMMDKKSAQEAEAAARKRIDKLDSTDKTENGKIFEEEVSRRAIRTIDKEYFDAQKKAVKENMPKEKRLKSIDNRMSRIKEDQSFLDEDIEAQHKKNEKILRNKEQPSRANPNPQTPQEYYDGLRKIEELQAQKRKLENEYQSLRQERNEVDPPAKPKEKYGYYDRDMGSRMTKSARTIETIIEVRGAKVRKMNEYHDPVTGQFTFAPRQRGSR